MTIVLPTSENIARAARELRSGRLVAFPTETVYGLGADATNERAVERIFEVKGRPRAHPLILHIGQARDAWKYSMPPTPMAEALARAFWPGPLTMVVSRNERVIDAVTGGGSTVGLRVPSHPVALRLLEDFGGAIAAPSANRFTRVSPTTAEHVAADLADDVEMVLDGGSSEVGLESTIIDLTRSNPVLLRPGGLDREAIEFVLERPVTDARGDDVTPSPGQHAIHYSPRARVILVETIDSGRAVLDLLRSGKRVYWMTRGEGVAASMEWIRQMSSEGIATSQWTVWEMPNELSLVGRELYARLREADQWGADFVMAEKVPLKGVGYAIMDRLRRAAG